MLRLLYALLAAGTALSNSTTETVLASYELPANAMQAGKVYRLRAAVRATATNSTDTLQVKLRVGGTTLTGTVTADSAAVDAADNNVVVLDIEFTVRSITSGTAVVIADGFCSTVGAEGTSTGRAAFESLSLTSTSAIKFEVTGTWSAASSSDSAQAESFKFYEIT